MDKHAALALQQLEELPAKLGKLQLLWSDDQQELLRIYCLELCKWNQKFNFVSRKDIQRLVDRHVVDSLTATSLLVGPQVLDVGSGAGLPGIPLAVMCPSIHFTLLDRSERRTRFLRHVLRLMKLENVDVLCQELGPQHVLEQKFDTVVSRAVKDPAAAWPLVCHQLTAQGQVLVFASTQAGHAHELDDDGEIIPRVLSVPDEEVTGVRSKIHEFDLGDSATDAGPSVWGSNVGADDVERMVHSIVQMHLP